MHNKLTELENKVSTLTRLMDVSAKLNSTLQLDDLLTYIMDTATDIADCEGASVLLWDKQTRELYFTASTTKSSHDILGKSVPLDGSIAGTVMQERQIMQVDDTANDPRHYTGIQDDGDFTIHSLLAIPLTVKNRLIGVLEVVNKRQLPWTHDDRQHLSTLADQAAVAIEGAQLVTALKRANKELSQLDQLKNDFIAIASHELRTPLGVILGYASFLQEGTDAAARDHAEKVMNSALKLRKIIEDLTNLRYLQQKASDLQLAQVPIEQLIQDVRFDVLTLLEAREQQLDVTLPPETLHVQVDRARMAMALTNVLTNAIEFTAENERITLKVERRGGEVWIQFADRGIGIEPQQLERIFERFYQIENHMTRHHEGLGIGLSISRVLVQAHSGRIWAKSDGLGTGTTVTVALPVSEDHIE